MLSVTWVLTLNEVECVVCKVWWHHKCVGLTGLTKTDCKKIAEYKCPSCFVFADEIAVKLADEATEAVPAKIEESDQGEATLNELKKGLDELKGMLITRNMAALPTAQQTLAHVAYLKNHTSVLLEVFFIVTGVKNHEFSTSMCEFWGSKLFPW